MALEGVLDLVRLLYGDGDSQRIDDTANAQPALFAVEVALAELWRSWGVEPAILIGHSLGEYAAACVAGTLSIEDGLRLLVRRGQLTQALPGDGAMASVMAAPDCRGKRYLSAQCAGGDRRLQRSSTCGCKRCSPHGRGANRTAVAAWCAVSATADIARLPLAVDRARSRAIRRRA